jgi:enoyl-CoA hydratase/carnithine racemase
MGTQRTTRGAGVADDQKEEGVSMAMQQYVHVETLEEYSERFKDYAHLERTEDGILLCRLGWKGEACVWSYQTQRSLGELWTAIGHDKKNEVIILTCEDPYWITQRSDPASFDEVEDSTDVGLKYECNVPDTMNFVARFIHDIEVPVVAAINGIGQHYEFALMADVCICYPEFYFSDAHFSHNIVPGDGMNFSYRMCLGQRRASYMAYMEPKIDAKTALDWGLVDEVVPHDKLIARAYEIANHIMKTGRPVRRLTHELVMRPWKRFFQDDERVRVLAEMYAVQLEATRHNFDKIAADFTGDRPQQQK